MHDGTIYRNAKSTPHECRRHKGLCGSDHAEAEGNGHHNERGRQERASNHNATDGYGLPQRDEKRRSTVAEGKEDA